MTALGVSNIWIRCGKSNQHNKILRRPLIVPEFIPRSKLAQLPLHLPLLVSVEQVLLTFLSRQVPTKQKLLYETISMRLDQELLCQ